MFFHTSLLKGCEGEWCGEGGYKRGNARRNQKQLFSSCSQSRHGVKAFFFFPQGEVFANRPLTVWAAQSKVVFVHLLKIVMYIVPVQLSSTVNLSRHDRCSMLLAA